MKLETALGVLSQSRLVDQHIHFPGIFDRQLDNSLGHPVGRRQGTEQVLGDVLNGIEGCPPLDEKARAIDLSPLHLCGAAGDLGNDEELVILGLAKVNTLDGAGINDRRVIPFVKILRLVDVTHGHVIEPVILHQGGRQDQVTAQHNHPFRAEQRTFHRGMRRQDEGQAGIGLAHPILDQARNAILDPGEQLSHIHSTGIDGGHQPGA